MPGYTDFLSECDPAAGVACCAVVDAKAAGSSSRINAPALRALEILRSVSRRLSSRTLGARAVALPGHASDAGADYAHRPAD